MNGDSNNQVRKSWHTKTSEQVFSMLDTNGSGLDSVEASLRLLKYGENKLPEIASESLAIVFLRQFQSPLIYVLIAAGGAVLALGETIDAAVIFAVLFINAVIGSIQEGRAQNTLASLRKFVETRATVLRDGREVIIADENVVPGDILMVQEGERIPADARLISVRNLRVDEAALTGESTPARKIAEVLEGENIPTPERRNLLFKGTHVATGTGHAVVVGTGLDTEIGILAREIATISTDVPLKTEIEKLTRLIIFITALIASSLFTIGIIMGKAPSEMFLTVVALSVSIIPEGLPIVLTLVLATGVWRMGKQNALVKKMHAVEALGQVDILAVDKTGTLTKNEMVVQKIYTNNTFFNVGGVGYEPLGEIFELENSRLGQNEKEIEIAVHPELLLVGKISAFSANAHVIWSDETNQWNLSGDPTEAAMLVLSQKLGFHKDILESESPIIAEMPFDYNLKYHAVLAKEGGQNVLSLAGAPEIILDFCDSIWKDGKKVLLSVEEREIIESILVAMSKEGLRVIALATQTDATDLPNMGGNPAATFIGFLGMHDALRAEVPSTILRAREAGIRTVMITGDHRITAQSIAQEAGIWKEGDRVLTGREMEHLSDDELLKIILNVSVFARVTPEHKLRIIRAYKKAGNIVAMSGDGVNDAPSLGAADLGVAMGGIGTEVAKEASDIVLLDDNLGSIITAVEEGRSIYRTIKKVILYLFSTSAGEVLTIAGAIILGYIVPILPAQIIWLNFVTDGFLDTALAMEPKEKGLLLEPRTKSARQLVDSLMATRMVLMAGAMALGTLYLFGFYQDDPVKAWTISLTLLAVFQWFNALNCRSHRASILHMNPFSNIFLLGALFIVISLQIGAMYTSAGQHLLHTVPLSLSEWGIILGIASSIIVVEEIRKLIYRLYYDRKIPTLAHL
ncbi:MAG: HAD-IC family P-type ATPase [Candidatus Pacebacteria bacterium]|jgi:Ca2+-transporting ATPase|nr:HAD-IC family P-type ATPase [Candidatus Paceibacterota bacterium]